METGVLPSTGGTPVLLAVPQIDVTFLPSSITVKVMSPDGTN